MEMTLSRMLAVAKTRPTLYLPAPRLTYLEPFVGGFLLATRQGPDNPAYSKFLAWLFHSKGIGGAFYVADDLIRLTGSDEKAFDEFFRLFDEFVRSHSVGIEPVADAEARMHAENEAIHKARLERDASIDRKRTNPQ